MEIKAIRFREGGFATRSFAFGGEDGAKAFDASVRYRSGMQNYLIDTGEEIILVDTGFPAGTPEESPDETTPIFTGHTIKDYIDAFLDMGYRPEQVTKILLTHKHSDHSGALDCFPNAKIYVNHNECDADELKGLPNLVPVHFTDGPFHNFPESQKIVDGIHFIRAEGHTKGTSIVIAEWDGLFYLIHGDVTYVDEALYENKLSVVFDDITAARKTLDRIREFVSRQPTVYLSTHTPQACESLEAKRIIDLNNPPETIPVGEVTFKTKSGKYVCSVCGYIYDPAVGDEKQGIPAGTPFEDLPSNWLCPKCRRGKDKFNAA